jgi:hypothetical protein
MVPAQFKLITTLAKVKQVAILREPFFRYYGNLAGWQRKFLFMIKDMVF